MSSEGSAPPASPASAAHLGRGSPSLTVARFELLRQIRRRRLLILLAIAAIFVVLLIVVLQVFGSGTGDAYSYASTFGIWVSILAALAATFFGADALVGEFEHRTGYLLFPQPVSRTSIFIGKALAALTLAALVMAAYYGVVVAATGIVKGSVPIEIGYSFLLAILYTAAALGIAFLFSGALRGVTMASVLTFTVLFFILAVVTQILTVAGVRPDGNLAFAEETITNILSGPYPEAYPVDRTETFPGGGTIRVLVPAVPLSILIMAIWAAVGFGLAWALFRRREMKG